MNKKVRIMVVDDESIVGDRLKASLGKAGYHVDSFTSSREAIDRLEEEDYDILVTDLKMENPDGMEILRIAKRRKPDILPVIITGFATKETAEEAKRNGAVEFIAKPFRISRLKALISALARGDIKTGKNSSSEPG